MKTHITLPPIHRVFHYRKMHIFLSRSKIPPIYHRQHKYSGSSTNGIVWDQITSFVSSQPQPNSNLILLIVFSLPSQKKMHRSTTLSEHSPTKILNLSSTYDLSENELIRYGSTFPLLRHIPSKQMNQLHFLLVSIIVVNQLRYQIIKLFSNSKMTQERSSNPTPMKVL